MNKVCISLLICVAITILPTTYASSETNVVLHKKFPSLPQSCPPKDSFGYFWDGQKCEVCMPNCTCESYLGCIQCAEGFGRLFHKHHSEREPEAACYKCEENRTDGDNAASVKDDVVYTNPKNIKSCCFQKSEVILHTDTQGAFRSYTVKALRALSCAETDSTGAKVVQFGSYCFSSSYCQAYTEYGRCTKCAEGYYLDNSVNNKCIKCGSDSDHCAQCSSADTCDQCEAGFYNPTFSFVKKNGSAKEIEELSKNPFMCKPCSKTNCNCNEENICTSCVVTKGYYHENNKGCVKCTNSFSHCAECDSRACSTCESGYRLDKQKCVACAPHCAEDGCQIVEGKGKCTEGFCENGYYYKKDTQLCEACPNDWARCTLNDDNVVIPTQCKQNSVTHPPKTKGYEWVKQRLPIYKDNAFLIKKNKALLCQSNQKTKCREMKTDLAEDEEASCLKCYEDFGYVLNPKTKVCELCSDVDSNCVECSHSEDKLVCKTCFQRRDHEVSPDTSILNKNDFKNYHPKEGKCVECKTGCLECDVDGNCPNKCQNGYRFNDTECVRCKESQCMTCADDKEVCQQCFPGFRLWKSSKATSASEEYRCEECEPKCLKCDDDRKVCTKCEEGHYLFNGVCRPKRDLCMEHQNDGACKHCQYGYRNVQGYCFDCKTAGYINCPVGCTSTDAYVRDGDILTQEYYEKRMEDLYRPISGSLLQFISAACILIASLLI